MSTIIDDLAREAAGPWTPVIASLLGAVVSPVLTAVVGRSAARRTERDKAPLDVARVQNDQRIRTGDISGSAHFKQTVDQRHYSSTTIHQPTAASSGNSDVTAWLVGFALVSLLVILATAKLGLSLLAALPWAPTFGAVILLIMTLRQWRARSQMPVSAPIAAILLAGMCWAVALFVGGSDDLKHAIAHVNQHGYNFGDPSAGVILWLFAANVLIGLAAIAVLGLTVSARLRNASQPEGKHWTGHFIGHDGFRSWLGGAITCGTFLALILAWPAAKVVLGL
ncbi:hypothetical protein ACVWY0_003034 [Arthrobacter sp. UYNi723]